MYLEDLKNMPVYFVISQLDITPGPDGRFGFTIVGDCPLLVEDCMLNSPAGRSGLRAGDYVMEVNGIPVKHHEMAAAMIKASQGRTLRLGVLRMNRWQKRISSSMKETYQSGDIVRQDRKHKALEFNKKVSTKSLYYKLQLLEPSLCGVGLELCAGDLQYFHTSLSLSYEISYEVLWSYDSVFGQRCFICGSRVYRLRRF